MSTNDFEFNDRTDTEPADNDGTAATQREQTAARAELLAEENRRLRAEYARDRQSQYRRTAIGLGAIGLVAVVAGIVFPGSREVLLALGATGLFGGLLTYYLTPGQFVAASVGERVYAAWAENGAALAAELGLRDDRVYLPTDDSATARLYVPLHTAYELPTALDGPIALEEDEHGLVLMPTGATLFEEFQRALPGKLATAAPPLAAQLCDGLVEQFELADSADADVDPTDGRVMVAISDSAFGAVDRFDHPISSFVAVGLASGLERPVTLEVTPGDERADWLVTCRFETDTGDERGA